MRIQTAEFVTSVGPTGPLPTGSLPQIALVGRSNVGKSTLINGLSRRTVARAGGAPGTTRLLNVYLVELARRRGKLLLIDLPGYGYAKVSRRERESWQGLVESYLGGRASLRVAVLLQDLRRDFSEDEELLLA